eukprot:TRINITY_DN7992_c0_g1_i1.p1 TRINITY_DN7992_c0_g1~~TRINITY_DN7992_c0_g1_i1.p1  ORF type:complete len:373 (+),score=76.36 TRINITY_DN7992_c0_g1_i1:68-1186(+)
MHIVRRLFRQGAHSLQAAFPPAPRPDDDGGWASEAVQEFFVREVLRDPLLQQYAPQNGYPYRVAKRVFGAVEGAGAAAADSLVEELLRLQPAAGTASGAAGAEAVAPFYRLYDLPGASESGPVALRVWPDFSQVGLALWPAGFALAEWLLARPTDFAGARVVELGSGVGLTGMVLARSCGAASVLLTDYLTTVTANCAENLARCGLPTAAAAAATGDDAATACGSGRGCPGGAAAEGAPDEAAKAAAAGTCTVDVEVLDWEKVSAGDETALSIISRSAATHLLAADVVYDHDVIPALADTVRTFARLCPGLESVVFAVTHRTEESFGMLGSELRRCGFALHDPERLPHPPPERELFHYERSDVRIYTLRPLG